MRIDTVRNRLAATIAVLTSVSEEIEDLHALAYDRPSAVDEAKVAGGSANYYLDTHGDTRARSAYREMWRAADTACNLLDEKANNALNLLRAGDTPGRSGPRLVRLVELGEAIAAQSRRARRGDYAAVRRGPQPDEGKAIAELTKQRDDLSRRLVEVTQERDRLRSQLARPRRERAS